MSGLVVIKDVVATIDATATAAVVAIDLIESKILLNKFLELSIIFLLGNEFVLVVIS